MRLGYLIVIMLCVFTLFSCTKNSYHHKIVKDFYTYYSNDSVELSYKFPADYRRLKKWSDVNFFPEHSFARKKNFLISFETEDKPFLQYSIFVTKAEKSEKLSQEPVIDSANNTIRQSFFNSNKNINIHFIAHSNVNDFDNLIREYRKIFSSVKVGQSYEKAVPKSPFNIAREAFVRKDSLPNYILPVLSLREKRENYQSLSEKSQYIQALGTFTSFIGSEQDSLAASWKSWRSFSYLKNIPENGQLKYIYKDKNALKYLLDTCTSSKVVMFNEAHFDPQHRMLPELLLKDLYEKGFKYLALEALWEDSQSIQSRGFPILSSGFYISEPAMANFIRKALKIGYEVVGYDDFRGDREKKQAQNLFNRTIKKDFSSKVLVLAGFGHISEKKSERKNMMAREFYELTGIDPLTIEQVEYMNTLPEDNWLAIVDTKNIEKKPQADVFVANSLWKKPPAADKTSVSIQVPEEITDEIRKGYAYGLYIYLEEEVSQNPRAIPVDVFLLDKLEKIETQLENGQAYRLSFVNHQGKIIINESIKL